MLLGQEALEAGGRFGRNNTKTHMHIARTHIEAETATFLGQADGPKRRLVDVQQTAGGVQVGQLNDTIIVATVAAVRALCIFYCSSNTRTLS